MTEHVKHHSGGIVTLSADFICAMVSFGEFRQEAKQPKPVKTSKAVKAKTTSWKTKRAKR